MLVFVTPHQVVEGICKKLVGKLRPGAEAISLIKGMEVKMEGPCMISKLITNTLGINCCVLMGANIADEAKHLFNLYHAKFLVPFKGKKKISGCAFQMQIAVEKFSEATIGYREDKQAANRWAKLFTTSYFLVAVVSLQLQS